MASKRVATGIDSHERMWQQAYDRIRKDILRHVLQPGEAISEVRLSKTLGISRTPVREALNRLELDGLIVSNNRHKRVNALTVEEINATFELKKAIEGHMIRLAAERANEDQLGHMRAILARFQTFLSVDVATVSGEDELIDRWTALDEEFHDLVFDMAKNRRAAAIVRNLNSPWLRIRAGLLRMEGRLESNVREHIEMAAAVLEKDGQKSGQLITVHLEKLRKTLTDIMEAFHIPL